MLDWSSEQVAASEVTCNIEPQWLHTGKNQDFELVGHFCSFLQCFMPKIHKIQTSTNHKKQSAARLLLKQ